VPPSVKNSLLPEIHAISTNFRHNEQIRISPIFLINDKDEKLGSVSTGEALKMAREAGLDLVEVAPTARPPVCRIMDYGKWRYQQQKKEDKSRASSRGGQLKELKLRTVRIGDHDLEIKINHAREFLKEGNKVQFTLQFKGREMAHLELGRDIMKKVRDALWLVSKVERDAKMEGRRMTLLLQPEHKNPATAKQPVTGTVPVAPKPAIGAPRPAAPLVAGSSLNIPPRPSVAAPAPRPAQASRPEPAPVSR
jgi:translation initiation factor IF-3